MGVNPLKQITLLTIHCPDDAGAVFQDDTLPCYFVGVHFVCINASPGHKLFFPNALHALICAIHAIQQ